MKDFNVMALLLNPEFSSMLLSGLKVTLFVALGSWLLAMSLAVVLLAVRLSPSRMAQRVVEAYISYHRNIPPLVKMMLWYFGIAHFLPDTVQAWLAENQAEAVFAVIALGLCQAAYFCEDLRSGFRAVPMGQTEAARALGHSYTGAMRHVLMPQAVRNAVPALVNHSVSLFKNSSLAMAIGAAELTHAVKEMESRTFRAFEAYLIATVIFLIISLLIMAVGSWIERRTALTTAR